MGKKQSNGDCIITLQDQTLTIHASMGMVIFSQANSPILFHKCMKIGFLPRNNENGTILVQLWRKMSM